MTAVLCRLFDDRIVFYTDGALYDKGLLLFPHQKVGISLHPSCVLATRGEARAGVALKLYTAFEPTFDRLVDTMAGHMRKAIEFGCSQGDSVNLAAFFGGWSDRAQKFQLYRTWIGGDNLETLYEGSLQLRQINVHEFEPWPNQKLLEERGIMRDGALDFRAGDADIIKFMQCQRETIYPLGPGSDGDGCLVGCFIQKTVLTRDSATTEIIHRWPADKIGEPLGKNEE